MWTFCLSFCSWWYLAQCDQNRKYMNLLVLVDFSFPVPLVVWAFCHIEGDVSI